MRKLPLGPGVSRRDFLRFSGFGAGAACLTQLFGCGPAAAPPQVEVAPPVLPPVAGRSNWAGNVPFSGTLHRPATVERLQELVRDGGKFQPLGTGHSFSPVATSATNGDQISVSAFNSVRMNEDLSVTIGGGVRYGEAFLVLHRAGRALPNAASFPHASIAGSTQTGTHGSGLALKCLTDAIRELKFVNGRGQVVTLHRDRDGASFRFAVLSIGLIGPIFELTLDTVPAFEVQQFVYDRMPMREVADNFLAIMGLAYSVSFFTHWTGGMEGVIDEVWLKHKVNATPFNPARELYGATRATANLHPVRSLSAEPCTPQMGVAGPWFNRLPHFLLEGQPSSAGDELHSEFLIPIGNAVPAIRAVAGIGDRIDPVLWVTEIRTVDADDFPMSPFCGRRCAAIHFTWKKDWPRVQPVLEEIQRRLAPFEARPHWGKIFTIEPKLLQALYPNLDQFRGFIRDNDPETKFGNEFLARYLGV